MITLIQAFFGQIEILLIGMTLLLLRKLFTHDKTPVRELFPDYVTNKYFLTFLMIMWFGFFTWLTWYTQSPRYGIWSHLFSYSPVMCIVALVVVITSNIIIICKDRKYYNRD